MYFFGCFYLGDKWIGVFFDFSIVRLLRFCLYICISKFWYFGKLLNRNLFNYGMYFVKE